MGDYIEIIEAKMDRIIDTKLSPLRKYSNTEIDTR